MSRLRTELTPAVRRPRIDRATLLDRLGPVDQPAPDVHAWLSRAQVAAKLPDLVGLDNRSCFDLCVLVVRHLTRGRRAAR